MQKVKHKASKVKKRKAKIIHLTKANFIVYEFNGSITITTPKHEKEVVKQFGLVEVENGMYTNSNGVICSRIAIDYTFLSYGAVLGRQFRTPSN